MHEDSTRPTTGQPSRATSDEVIVTPRTDPKFARESFTMRRMQRWQIVALVVVLVAALAVGLVVYT